MLAGADLMGAAGDVDHRRARLDRLGAREDGRKLVAVDHLQELEHRLVVLVLVRDQHLVDEPVAEARVLGALVDVDGLEHVESALPDLAHVGAQLLAAQDRQLVAGGSRVLDRVVVAAQAPVERRAATGLLDEPELLEVGDVAEVPGERAEQRRVDRVELLVAELLDQQQGALARLAQSFGDRVLRLCRGGRRDSRRLPGCAHVPIASGSCQTSFSHGGVTAKGGAFPARAIASNGISRRLPGSILRLSPSWAADIPAWLPAATWS